MVPPLPENKPAMFYRILGRMKKELREHLKVFMILGMGIFTPTTIA